MSSIRIRRMSRPVVALVLTISCVCWTFLVGFLFSQTSTTTLLYHRARASEVTRPWNVTVLSRVSPCRPQHRIVYIKTHKTGSSTVTNILERYGYLRGLNFALPKALSFSATKKFDPSQVYLNYLKDGNGSSIWPALGGFHLVVNHLRYNRKELEATIPNAVYVTIIREPASQFLSAMCYYKLGSQGKAKSMADTLDIALADPEKYLNVFARNGHAYDLGMDPASFSDPVAVNKTIESLSRELDLVMITEYFDESLILLKKLLCCDFEDILYIAKGVGKGCASRNITSDAREKIRRLNHVDVKLYQHFNRTFWDKVRDYGPTFQQDLRSFREIKEANTEMCLTGASERIDGHSAVVLRVGKNASEKCNNLFREDVQWVSILKRYMQNKSSTFVKGIDKRH
ncbi:galactose-3-O-sulfotransferase 4-like [Acanthaster planci]|uniref:Galactose-3-O-sulfotransferase 4-like n=1 Tax=Acanthaster planci TaxID=133434 RepID=A0A8B7YY04_ACAPL|nr:galactose-3-O-sulfotransferase 4-like [Acanthaster planci]